jgi:hypothetical protein
MLAVIDAPIVLGIALPLAVCAVLIGGAVWFTAFLAAKGVRTALKR